MDNTADHVFKLHITAVTPLNDDCFGSFHQSCHWELKADLSLKIINDTDDPIFTKVNGIVSASAQKHPLQPSVNGIFNDISHIEKMFKSMDFQQNN